MKSTDKKFCELAEGEHFWICDSDVGNPDIERVKLKGAFSALADGDPGCSIFQSDFVVYVRKYPGWYEYLIWICIASITLLAIAFGWWIVNYFKGL